RMGLDAISVESDTGAMGGDVAHEFQVLTDAGEDRLLLCESCDYRANMEKATRRIPDVEAVDAAAASEIATPGTATIEALTAMTGEPPSAFLKTMLLRGADGVVAVVLPGDREVNEAKLRKLLGAGEIRFAGDDDFAAADAVPGYIGPAGLRARVVVDTSVEPRPYVAGANKRDAHLRDVMLGRDFDGERLDLHDVRGGDLCPRCGGRLALRRGVEVGNIFKFGPYYSEKMDATFLAEDGTRRPFFFGSYGIGVGRLLQTIIETNRDDRGIVWPIQVAPFDAHVIVLPLSDGEVRVTAERLVADLEQLGAEVLHDDRNESAGVKFADADLIGLPFRVTVSRRSLRSRSVELKERSGSEVELVDVDAAAERISSAVRRARETARAL
ncbi:MAG: His/Gly/Thr/Pro-type tRNA ligase C-terminal domain-containing protein, partial [Chloroflexota bacterium]|nr:His/Gly/Thr/Pro-type tRNA ligase C-terminal domain-containing protein [Chloroflexota bacterium]